jgi:hypothetical protein
MRSIAKRNRRGQCAAASLGKYHSASADSHSYAKSFAVSQPGAISIPRWIAGSVAIAVTDICVSHFEPSWSGSCRTGKPDAYANSFAS